MMTIEERLDQLEKRDKRLTVALAVLTVAICAVVTMAATGEKRGDFDVVTARNIFIANVHDGMAVPGAEEGKLETHRGSPLFSRQTQATAQATRSD